MDLDPDCHAFKREQLAAGCTCCSSSSQRTRDLFEPERAAETNISDITKSAPPDILAKEIAEFEAKTAVEVVRKNDKFEYKISFQGKDKILAASDASTKGLAETEKKLAQLVSEKQTELEKTFNVSFSKVGDDVVKQWVEKPDCSWERGAMVKARTPNLLELYGIQAALYRCQPSDISAKGQGIKFHFLEDNYYKDQPVLAYFISQDKDGRAAVYFEPGSNKGKPATELDSERFGKDFLFSIEALTSHELSHNHQEKTSWYSGEKEKLAKAIGWMPFLDAKSGATDFMLRGQNGEFYRYGKDHCKDSKVWVKCDKNGVPLDAADKAATFKTAKQYKRAEIQDNALVKPLTYYFPTPVEMFAEGLMLYRLGSKNQEKLLRESPSLYKCAKEQDQIEVDSRYGKTASGESRYIRSTDGLLKENNQQERNKVKEFEDRIEKERQLEKKTANSLPAKFREAVAPAPTFAHAKAAAASALR